MLSAILLATLLVASEGNQPPVIHNDLVNEVSLSTNHDYEVHDHDADQENRPDEGQRYFSILVPTVAQESVQDHKIHKSNGQGNDQVSVEVNGNSGLIDPFLDNIRSGSVVSEDEVLHHGDFDKVPQRPLATHNLQTFDSVIDIRKRVPNFPSNSSPYNPLEDLGKEGGSVILVDVKSGGDDKEDEWAKKDQLGFPKTNDDVLLEKDEDSTIENTDFYNDAHLRNSLPLPNNGNNISEIVYSGQESTTVIYAGNEPNETIFENIDIKENSGLKPPSKNETTLITTSKTIFLQKEDQQQHSSSTTVANTPLLKVHVLEDINKNKKNKHSSTLSTKSSGQSEKNKSLKESPITHIKVSPDWNPPKLVKDVLSKPIRRRVLIKVKNKTRLIPKSEDSVVSSTTDSSSSADIEDEQEDDLQQSPQDQIVNSDPVYPGNPQEENLSFNGPPDLGDIPAVPVTPHIPLSISTPIPPPVPPPYLERYPIKAHQPILHHIVHALLHPSNPDDEDYPEDPILHRYSPHFVPYPAVLHIPF